ncbi:hypothetical protein E8E13_003325 [Curvularia kusanoi]|uniref:Heterokaryon incompatibility domain-containing protein n=1 Tax=Curvularia kusanoi TaxID=90978 RepID=A0A9P4W797_CURKU|nr:hypothetical protein E8E13_003325 [Curvularia kusanoi]
MAGFAKIVGCCDLARRDGYQWAWVDTCCIDKRSSSELSEAINSMYKWYWEAAICYAYLSDVSTKRDWKQEFEKSRWFTRGWTLQELLAPAIVEFYDEAWKSIGRKRRMAQQIQTATGIEQQYFLERDSIKSANIATKFRWAAYRKTTRVEDIAYCLLGLVEVNMPMLYGEGEHAFYRLQRELLTQSNDHSILAWRSKWSCYDPRGPVLAPSPRQFDSTPDIRSSTMQRMRGVMTHEITSVGLRISLPCIPKDKAVVTVILNCEDGSGRPVGVELRKLSNGVYVRNEETQLDYVSEKDVEEAEMARMYLSIDPVRKKYRTTDVPYDVGIGIRSILSESPYYVHDIAISNRFTTQTRVLPYQTSHLDLQDRTQCHRDRFRKFRLWKGREAAGFDLMTKDGDYAVTVVVGSHRDFPKLGFFKILDPMARNRKWAEEIDTQQHGWELANDYAQMADSDHMLYQMQARQCWNKESNSQRWDVDITIIKCSCEKEVDDCSCHAGQRSLHPFAHGQYTDDCQCDECTTGSDD